MDAAIKRADTSHNKIEEEPNWLTGDLGRYPDIDVSLLPTTLSLVHEEEISKVSGPVQRNDLLKPLLMDIAKKGLSYAYNKYARGVQSVDGWQDDRTEQTSKPKHVIIVGAGMAGLVAAHELVRVGHKVTILEMQDRIGGRVKTLSGDDGEKKTHKQGGSFAKGLYVDGKYLSNGRNIACVRMSYF